MAGCSASLIFQLSPLVADSGFLLLRPLELALQWSGAKLSGVHRKLGDSLHAGCLEVLTGMLKELVREISRKQTLYREELHDPIASDMT